jgi:hypothetical protein
LTWSFGEFGTGKSHILDSPDKNCNDVKTAGDEII